MARHLGVIEREDETECAVRMDAIADRKPRARQEVAIAFLDDFGERRQRVAPAACRVVTRQLGGEREEPRPAIGTLEGLRAGSPEVAAFRRNGRWRKVRV